MEGVDSYGTGQEEKDVLTQARGRKRLYANRTEELLYN